MTLETVYYFSCKKEGEVKKTDKMAVFYDGLRRCVRRLYYNNDNGQFYVILKGEAYPAQLPAMLGKYYDMMDTIPVRI